jgi:hypothetical protein
MTVRDATERLWTAVHQLRDDVFALRLQAVEDYPLKASNKLIENVGTAAESMSGWASELLDSASRAVSAAGNPPSMPELHRAIDGCADNIERLANVLHERLTATVHIDELSTLARRSAQPELRAWVGAIKQALDQISQSLWTVHTALTGCWRELADRASPVDTPNPVQQARRR